jgi:murein DD-endopeptidase MepM/ murein hydrolase activator NlpD
MFALVGALLIAAACGGSSDPEPTATNAPPAATATPEGPDLTIFHDWIIPIEGGCLPESDLLMPNAPRDYRGGTHEGLDFYDVDNCTPIVAGTETIAAKDGVVIRADHAYTDITQEELDAANARIEAGEPNAFEVIDLFRGRQVWIDHGNGVVTRYAHLGGIPDGIVEGRQVVQGEVVGYIGDSGTPESLSNPGQETHLHWEVRLGETFLGEGLPAEEVRAIYAGLFEPVPDNASFE